MKNPTIFRRKTLGPKYLMFAIWTLQRKHKRAAHFNELLEYLSCSVELLRCVLSMQTRCYSVNSSQDKQFYTIKCNEYLPLR